MKKILILSGIGLIAIAVFGFITLRTLLQTRAGATSSVGFSQKLYGATEGSEVTVPVLIASEGKALITSLQFDVRLPDQVGITFANARIVGNSDLQLMQAATIDTGSSQVVRIVAAQLACVTHTAPLQVLLTFRTTTSGNWQLHMENIKMYQESQAYTTNTPDKTEILVRSKTDHTTTITPPAVPADQVSILFRLKLQGVTSGRTTLAAPVRMGVAVAGGALRDKTPFQYTTIQSDAAGIWQGFVTFPKQDLNPGEKYRIILKGPKHIARRFCTTKPIDTQGDGTYICTPESSSILLKDGLNMIDLTKTYLMAGDIGIEPVGQDGVLDSRDLGFVISRLSEKAQDSVAIADLNYDGIVDTQDLSIMVINLQRNEDEY